MRMDGQWEVFVDDDLVDWILGGSEIEDVDVNEGDYDFDSSVVLGFWVVFGYINDGDNELCDDYVNIFLVKKNMMVEFFDSNEGNWCGQNVDESSDKGDEEWVLDCVKLLEEGGVEVEDEVDIWFFGLVLSFMIMKIFLVYW